MDDDKKKQLMIGIIIACIALAIGITVYTNTGSGKAEKRKIFILCSECNESFELSREEFTQKMQQAAGEGGMGPMGQMGPIGPMGPPPVLTCSGCGKDTAQMATKCKSCDAVFIQNFQAAAEGDYPDKCPVCGHSEIEERMGQRQ